MKRSESCHSHGTCGLLENVKFNIWVGVRFESLVEWLDDTPSEMRPTMMKPIHLLRHNKDFVEWEFTSARDLEALRGSIFIDLEAYAFPFVERFSTLRSLRQALESPNKQEWFDAGFGLEERVTALAAIQLAEGNKSGAIKTLNDGIESLEKSLAARSREVRKRDFRKRGFQMEHLRRRLLAS